MPYVTIFLILINCLRNKVLRLYEEMKCWSPLRNFKKGYESSFNLTWLTDIVFKLNKAIKLIQRSLVLMSLSL